MTLENAIRTLDEVIPPHTHRTVDREHMPIVLAWEAVKVELENRVPVVRCRDCKYWGNEETKVATVCEFPCVQLFCVCDALKRMRKAGNCMTNEDFFCAHGEKRRADFVDDNKIGERKADE